MSLVVGKAMHLAISFILSCLVSAHWDLIIGALFVVVFYSPLVVCDHAIGCWYLRRVVFEIPIGAVLA